ncbi:phosphatidylserine decarboxylase [Haloglycomyces albus]|uniref:phosphatidylserine decarboxylase n=1 Tax=Haloglycomyces albus TaxID=526067 RepID=UPI00046D4F83|nr:phosphatidylserine decarboxylase [Haloglycomyces albus]
MPISTAAARGITDEFNRRRGPKTGLVIGAAWNDNVLKSALESLMPDDKLTVVTDAVDEVRRGLDEEGSWTSGNVDVLADVQEAAAVDHIMLATPVTVEAEEFINDIETLKQKVEAGGTLTFAATLTAPAREEIAELVADHGIGSDLIARSFPPLRIHKLRFDSAQSKNDTDDIAPAWRASSVPVSPGMHVDSNGVIAAGLCLGAALITKRLRPKSKAWMVPAALSLPVGAFFRDPERAADVAGMDPDPDSVLAASDGTVTAIETVVDERFGAATGNAGSDWLRISVFLSILDVHINRAPVSGNVVDIFTETGGFVNAMKPESEHNAACYTVFDTGRGRVAVAQRTGMIARRIVNRSKIGATVAKGERYGLIRFGSRTDIYLPQGEAQALVEPGDTVRGGESVLARWS